MEPCDGSCFANHFHVEEIPCEDGEILALYFCHHEQIWILATYAPPQAAKKGNSHDRVINKATLPAPVANINRRPVK